MEKRGTICCILQFKLSDTNCLSGSRRLPKKFGKEISVFCKNDGLPQLLFFIINFTKIWCSSLLGNSLHGRFAAIISSGHFSWSAFFQFTDSCNACSCCDLFGAFEPKQCSGNFTYKTTEMFLLMDHCSECVYLLLSLQVSSTHFSCAGLVWWSQRLLLLVPSGV